MDSIKTVKKRKKIPLAIKTNVRRECFYDIELNYMLVSDTPYKDRFNFAKSGRSSTNDIPVYVFVEYVCTYMYNV